MDFDPLFRLLEEYQGSRAFNQYRDVHPALDRPYGDAVRRHNLQEYLESFADARFALVGEAAGYCGCRFSGIPFTCETQLVGHARLAWTFGKELARSSTSRVPWQERSASIVWEILGARTDCVLWNAFPWHPFGAAGPLSNRPPGRDLQKGLGALSCFLALFPAAQPHAIGRVAERALEAIGVQAPYIRHPSHGGKRRFSTGVTGLGAS